MKPGIKDVAKVAGVSPTTVSRVLNDRGYISEETRKKVYRAMKTIDYTPNEIARALLNNRTYLVGVIVPSISSPFHGQVVQYVEQFLAKDNYKTLLCNSKNRSDTEKEYVSMLRRNQVDGIIVGTHNENLKEYEEAKLPIVAIDRYIAKDVATVSCDNYIAGKIATERLIAKGCRHILCIRGNSRLKMPGNDRSRAYMETMKRYHYEPLIMEVEFIKTIEEKKKLVSEMLGKHPEIDGVFAGDDTLAVLVLNLAREKGIQIPKDMKVIGVDGAEQTLSMVPELTTVQQPIEAIARVTVQTLIDQIEGKEVESHTDLPVRLIEGTTA